MNTLEMRLKQARINRAAATDPMAQWALDWAIRILEQRIKEQGNEKHHT